MLNLLPWRKTKNDGRPRWRGGSRDDRELFFDRLFSRWMEPVDVQSAIRLFGGLKFDDLDREVVMRIDVPGFDANELEVCTSGNVLTIVADKKEQGKKKSPAKADGAGAHTFRRTVTLPEGIDTDAIEGRYHSGVLEIHMPKTERAKPKKIAIQS